MMDMLIRVMSHSLRGDVIGLRGGLGSRDDVIGVRGGVGPGITSPR